MQHITPRIWKDGIIQTSRGGTEKIKGPAHMAEGDHHLRKDPNPNPLEKRRKDNSLMLATIRNDTWNEPNI